MIIEDGSEYDYVGRKKGDLCKYLRKKCGETNDPNSIFNPDFLETFIDSCSVKERIEKDIEYGFLLLELYEKGVDIIEIDNDDIMTGHSHIPKDGVYDHMINDFWECWIKDIRNSEDGYIVLNMEDLAKKFGVSIDSKNSRRNIYQGMKYALVKKGIVVKARGTLEDNPNSNYKNYIVDYVILSEANKDWVTDRKTAPLSRKWIRAAERYYGAWVDAIKESDYGEIKLTRADIDKYCDISGLCNDSILFGLRRGLKDKDIIVSSSNLRNGKEFVVRMRLKTEYDKK